MKDKPKEKRKLSAEEREKEKPLRARVKKIESLVEAMDKELTGIETKLADPAVYGGPTAELARLGQRQAELRGEKAELGTLAGSLGCFPFDDEA